jgi:hypothetical protein
MEMGYKFYIKDIPDTYTVWGWILKNTDIKKHQMLMKPKSVTDPTKLLTLKHDFDIPALIKSVTEMSDSYGYNGWQSAEGNSPAYGGLSLVYNPNFADKEVDINSQTLGSINNNVGKFVYAQTENFTTIKNTYYDSYAFRKLAPCVTETAFNDFATSFERSMIRSRLAVINSKYVPENERARFGWHRDELVFENLRINIPIETDETFMFEITGSVPEHLAIGNAYSWDTNVIHRVFPTTEETKSRTHLVFGFSPWFDYNAQEDAWESNEFYGKMHPLDMLVSGNIHSKITGLVN